MQPRLLLLWTTPTWHKMPRDGFRSGLSTGGRKLTFFFHTTKGDSLTFIPKSPAIKAPVPTPKVAIDIWTVN